MTRKARIAIDARHEGANPGGRLHVVRGLAAGLAEITRGDDPERFFFLVYPGAHAWLRPYLGEHARLLVTRTPPPRRRALARARAVVDPLPASDGTLEGAGIELVHFVLSGGLRTRVPSVYTPHDLLHLHVPQDFDAWTRRSRERTKRALCAQARFVHSMTRWGREDLLARYGLWPERVGVIPWAPECGGAGTAALDTRTPPPAGEPGEGARGLQAGAPFALYPAKHYPHKNHLGLLEALALLRDRGQTIPLVLTGAPTAHTPRVEERIRALGLSDQVRDLGYVSDAELAGLYRRATAVVIPSRFEGWCLPLSEALAAGKPVACSDATCLPEVLGGAGLTFDPARPAAIAEALGRLWGDAGLREELARRARERAGEWSWAETARSFRALYRCALGRPLSRDDVQAVRAALSAAAPGSGTRPSGDRAAIDVGGERPAARVP